MRAEGEARRVEPGGPLIVRIGAGIDLAIDAAVAGVGIITIFEAMLRRHFDSGALVPVLEPWWQSFSGPFLYCPAAASSPRRSARSSIM